VGGSKGEGIESSIWCCFYGLHRSFDVTGLEAHLERGLIISLLYHWWSKKELMEELATLAIECKHSNS
jgi:hypothetical protein